MSNPWFKKLQEKQETLLDTCQICGTNTPTDDHGIRPKTLTLILTGGYNEFVDTFDGPIVVLLCHDCAHGLADMLHLDARGWHNHPNIGWHGLETSNS